MDAPNARTCRLTYINHHVPRHRQRQGKYKNFRKGIDELLQEGAVQLLYERNDQGQTSPILAAVGQLQFEVVQYRLQEEYGVVRACVRAYAFCGWFCFSGRSRWWIATQGA